MIQYARAKPFVRELSEMWTALREQFDFLPESVEYRMIPGAGAFAWTPVSSEPERTQIMRELANIVYEDNNTGNSIRHTKSRGDDVEATSLIENRKACRTRMKTLLADYRALGAPPPFTQYDMLATSVRPVLVSESLLDVPFTRIEQLFRVK